MGGYGVGIDVGTTFTAAAVVRDGRPTVVNLGTRRAAIPTVVFLTEDGRMLTGEVAEARAASAPSRVARAFKRRLGDPTPFLLGGSPTSAESLYAAVLGDVLAQVREREGGEPETIAVTHPANWGEYKLETLRHACHLAGVDDPLLVPEPVAAAVEYASSERIEDGTVVAVYDFGGGTFDASVLRRAEAGFEILGRPDGVEQLGGIDIDESVLGLVRAAVPTFSTLDPDDEQVLRAGQRIREECIRTKEALSGDTEATVEVLLPDTTTSIRVTRSELEDLVRPALGPSIEAVRRSIASAGLTVEDVDRVLLVGGSSRIPLVAQTVTSELGRPVALDADPKQVVALGAARLAAGDAAPDAVAAGAPVRAAARRPRRSFFVAAAVVVVVALVAAVVVATRGGSQRASAGSSSSASIPQVAQPNLARVGALQGLTIVTPALDKPDQAFSQRYAAAAKSDPAVPAPIAAARAYEATMVAVVAARAAGSDGSPLVEAIPRVTAGSGTPCEFVADCYRVVDQQQPVAMTSSIGGATVELAQFGDNVGHHTYTAAGFDRTGHVVAEPGVLTENRPAPSEFTTTPFDVSPRGGDGQLVIGFIPESDSQAGDADSIGVHLAIDEANAAGGFGGHPVALLVQPPARFLDAAAVQDAADALLQKHVDAVVSSADLGSAAADRLGVGTIPLILSSSTTLATEATRESLVFSVTPSLRYEVGDVPQTPGNQLGSVVVLDDDALKDFADQRVSTLQSGGATVTRIHVNPTATSFDDVARQAAAAHPTFVFVLAGRETPSVLAWLLADGVNVDTIRGYSGNITDAVGVAFTKGQAYASP